MQAHCLHVLKAEYDTHIRSQFLYERAALRLDRRISLFNMAERVQQDSDKGNLNSCFASIKTLAGKPPRLLKGLESADLIADRFAATGKVECTARIAAHERKTLFRKMLLAPHGIARHRTVSHGIAWLRMESEPSI